MRFPRTVALLAVAATQSGCLALMLTRASEETTSKVENKGFALAPRGPGCEVTVFRSGAPDRPVEVLAEVKTRLSRHLTGEEKLQAALDEELKKQACALGGDAVVVDDLVVNSQGEWRYANAVCRVVRAKPAGN